MPLQQQQAIGVFDSGMGGLTVLKALQNQLPDEAFIYLGDTARLPYGTKSIDTIKRYATAITRLLLREQIKMLIIACNTATTAALEHLQQQFTDIPIIGVIEPGAKTAVKNTRNNCITVLATETTIASHAYQTTIKRLNPTSQIITQSCSLFVALTEEGCIEDEIAIATIKKYLQPIINHPENPDCLVLGCTHFPLLTPPLKQLLGDNIHIVDSAHATAVEAANILNKFNIVNNQEQQNNIRFMVTDSPQRFARIGKLFLGRHIEQTEIEIVDAYLI